MAITSKSGDAAIATLTRESTPGRIFSSLLSTITNITSRYMFNTQPATSQSGQAGTNACGTGSSSTSNCQTLVLNSIDDFCVWSPGTVDTIGNSEAHEIAWCTKSGHGTRVMPQGTLKGVHFVKTPDYV